ncbi:MAG: type II toxin-antitoxin system HicB family antitoxin [Planctomycetota bacterium]
MRRPFTLEYWVDDGWFVGRLREVPGVFSQGETLEELEANIEDAYDLMRESQQAPVPSGSQLKEVELDV